MAHGLGMQIQKKIKKNKQNLAWIITLSNLFNDKYINLKKIQILYFFKK